MSDLRKIKRTLISLSDKSGLTEFATTLAEWGVEIISTGGTAKALRDRGVKVTEVANITGFPEMMGGRVKTLHPNIHGALLALRDNPEHVKAMETHGIEPIDLVVINLYPFEETIAKDNVSLAEAVENIDIGGPAMIRSASKNWRDVAVVTDPKLYDGIIEEMKANDGSLTLNTRQRLAALAYTRTASYDLAISSYLAEQLSADISSEPGSNCPPFKGGVAKGRGGATGFFKRLPPNIAFSLSKVADLRYGENPHQKAALYGTGRQGGIANAVQLHGKEMSFNNYVDADAAWNLAQEFDETAVAIIKHTNPSGVGIGGTNEEAYRHALSTDPVSAFGGIVAFNRTADAAVAASVIEVFTEVVIAPDYSADALAIFKTKKNLRVLVATSKLEGSSEAAYKQISGGMLVQEKDVYWVTESDLKIATVKQPTDDQIRAMLFAWKVCKHVKSNAIVFSNENQTIGVGSGQMNRVDSLRIAAMRAERFDLPLKGSVIASDAFFPFRDNIDEAAKLGVSAIIQPGGSVKDDETIAAADEHGIAMVFTSVRHFNH